MAVFPAGFSAGSAEEVCGDAELLPAAAILGALTALADAGLIRRIERTGGVRYQPYQTVREYAADQLADSGELAAMTAAHADYLLRLTALAGDGILSADQARWLDRLEPHREDIRFALERLLAAGRQRDALRLGGTVWLYWQQRGHLLEGYGLLDAALGETVPPDLDGDGCDVWARALTAAATLHYSLGGRDLVRDRYRQAAALWERTGYRAGVAAVLGNLAMYEHYSGDRRLARDVYAQALAAARETGQDRHISSVLQNLGTLLVQDGALAEAGPILDEALARARNLGSAYGEANITGTKAELALAAGDLDGAERLADATRRLFADLGDETGQHESTRLSAAIAAARGDDAAAFALYAAAVTGFRAAGYPWGTSEALRGQARAALGLGQAGRARSLAREARAICAQIGDQAGAGDADAIIAAAR